MYGLCIHIAYENEAEPTSSENARWYVHLLNTPISLCISTFWLESWMGILWVANGLIFPQAENLNSGNNVQI